MIIEVESGNEFLEVMDRLKSEGRRVYMVDWKPKTKKGSPTPHAVIHASEEREPALDPGDEPY